MLYSDTYFNLAKTPQLRWCTLWMKYLTRWPCIFTLDYPAYGSASVNIMLRPCFLSKWPRGVRTEPITAPLLSSPLVSYLCSPPPLSVSAPPSAAKGLRLSPSPPLSSSPQPSSFSPEPPVAPARIRSRSASAPPWPSPYAKSQVRKRRKQT